MTLNIRILPKVGSCLRVNTPRITSGDLDSAESCFLLASEYPQDYLWGYLFQSDLCAASGAVFVSWNTIILQGIFNESLYPLSVAETLTFQCWVLLLFSLFAHFGLKLYFANCKKNTYGPAALTVSMTIRTHLLILCRHFCFSIFGELRRSPRARNC